MSRHDAAPNLWLKLFLPFAAGYFLSYLYRTVNAVLGPVIARELTLGDNALGLLTSTYFLAFGAAQLPLGMLLDRFGPRRVEAGLLVIAAAGALVFGLSDSLGGLATGRALIGLGVSACLMASIKAISQWYTPDRLASMTGWIMASGGLGALVAAKPLELTLGFATWQQVVFALAGITLAVAALLWLLPGILLPSWTFCLPGPPSPATEPAGIARRATHMDVRRFSTRHGCRVEKSRRWSGPGVRSTEGA